MPKQTIWATEHTDTGLRTARRSLVLLTMAAVVLTGCTTPNLATQEDAPAMPDTAIMMGCPTPTPQDDLGLEQSGAVAGQGIQESASHEDTQTAGDENAVPSLAEREAMLDRANQGPVRPGVELEGSGVPPDPNLSLQPGTAEVDAAAPVSGTTHPDASDTTPTPCP